jgi:hypothetical protein
MDRIQSYVANQQILADELNDIQDQAVGTVGGTGSSILLSATPGMRVCSWIQNNLIANATLSAVDTDHDWRDYIVYVQYVTPTGGASQPGASGDYLYSLTPTLVTGYLGLGALGAASATVVNGVPPVPASGTSWATQVVTNLWLYASPTTGNLYLYNNTGSSIVSPHLFIQGLMSSVRT